MGRAWWVIALVLAACELDDTALGRTTYSRADGRPPARDREDEIGVGALEAERSVP